LSARTISAVWYVGSDVMRSGSPMPISSARLPVRGKCYGRDTMPERRAAGRITRTHRGPG
jgi:hypothetical protein